MLSNNGKGVVIFLEDIDKVLNQRNAETNEISLLMDGGETKQSNVITILTTNHIEKIDPTFLRGKRIGSVVTLGHLDKEAAQEMIEWNLRDENGVSILEEDCGLAAQAIEDSKIVPAFVAEILDRVKSHRIFTQKKTVNCEDILHSIKSYKKQMDIAITKKATTTPAEALISAIKEVFPQKPEEEGVSITKHEQQVIVKYLKDRGY